MIQIFAINYKLASIVSLNISFISPLWFLASLKLSATTIYLSGPVRLYPNQVAQFDARTVVTLEGHRYAIETIEYVAGGPALANATLLRLA